MESCRAIFWMSAILCNIQRAKKSAKRLRAKLAGCGSEQVRMYQWQPHKRCKPDSATSNDGRRPHERVRGEKLGGFINVSSRSE